MSRFGFIIFEHAPMDSCLTSELAHELTPAGKKSIHPSEFKVVIEMWLGLRGPRGPVQIFKKSCYFSLLLKGVYLSKAV